MTVFKAGDRVQITPNENNLRKLDRWAAGKLGTLRSSKVQMGRVYWYVDLHKEIQPILLAEDFIVKATPLTRAQNEATDFDEMFRRKRDAIWRKKMQEE